MLARAAVIRSGDRAGGPISTPSHGGKVTLAVRGGPQLPSSGPSSGQLGLPHNIVAGLLHSEPSLDVTHHHTR